MASVVLERHWVKLSTGFGTKGVVPFLKPPGAPCSNTIGQLYFDESEVHVYSKER